MIPKAAIRASFLTLSILLARLAAGTTVTGVDALSELQRIRTQRLGAGPSFDRSNASFARDMLIDPASPYSDAQPRPSFINDIAWAELMDTLPQHVDTPEALAVIRWDVGVTRARPGTDVPVPRNHRYRDRLVAASAIKADVDADIFWHMLDLSGYRHTTKAAFYAVGMQSLRAQIAATAPERRAALGVDEDVFQRVMHTRSPGHLREHDLRYLSALVQHRLIHWKAGGRASTGLRELPVAFRIARVAAAYHDTQGYFTTPPCRPDGSPSVGFAGTGSPDDPRDLCLVAATDRAVHRWYLEQARIEASSRRWQQPNEPHGLAGLASALALAFPLLELATMLEVVEAVVADDLAGVEAVTAEDAELASERANLLSCRIPQ